MDLEAGIPSDEEGSSLTFWIVIGVSVALACAIIGFGIYCLVSKKKEESLPLARQAQNYIPTPPVKDNNSYFSTVKDNAGEYWLTCKDFAVRWKKYLIGGTLGLGALWYFGYIEVPAFWAEPVMNTEEEVDDTDYLTPALCVGIPLAIAGIQFCTSDDFKRDWVRQPWDSLKAKAWPVWESTKGYASDGWNWVKNTLGFGSDEPDELPPQTSDRTLSRSPRGSRRPRASSTPRGRSKASESHSGRSETRPNRRDTRRPRSSHSRSPPREIRRNHRPSPHEYRRREKEAEQRLADLNRYNDRRVRDAADKSDVLAAGGRYVEAETRLRDANPTCHPSRLDRPISSLSADRLRMKNVMRVTDNLSPNGSDPELSPLVHDDEFINAYADEVFGRHDDRI